MSCPICHKSLPVYQSTESRVANYRSDLDLEVSFLNKEINKVNWMNKLTILVVCVASAIFVVMALSYPVNLLIIGGCTLSAFVFSVEIIRYRKFEATRNKIQTFFLNYTNEGVITTKKLDNVNMGFSAKENAIISSYGKDFPRYPVHFEEHYELSGGKISLRSISLIKKKENMCMKSTHEQVIQENKPWLDLLLILKSTESVELCEPLPEGIIKLIGDMAGLDSYTAECATPHFLCRSLNATIHCTPIGDGKVKYLKTPDQFLEFAKKEWPDFGDMYPAIKKALQSMNVSISDYYRNPDPLPN